jgi:hypothetical protein
LKIEVSQFLFQDYTSSNCPELQSNNISRDEKTFVQWLELMAAVSRKTE